jgi:thiol-disulfide isomerase/thioredoxin
MERAGSRSRIAAAALCLAALAACGGGRDAGAPGEATETGRPAGGDPAAGTAPERPEPASLPVAYADLDALRAALRERRGRPLLLNFWATWCGPCVEELPDLGRLAREQGGDGTAFVGVSFDVWIGGDGPATEGKVRGFLSEAGVAYANFIYRGDQDPIFEAFELPGPIPYSILYDRDGAVVKRWEGQVDIGVLRAALAELPQ